VMSNSHSLLFRRGSVSISMSDVAIMTGSISNFGKLFLDLALAANDHGILNLKYKFKITILLNYPIVQENMQIITKK
jgi:hypothetical protein